MEKRSEFRGARSARLSRWLWIGGGALAAIVIGGFLALKILFPQERLRALVVPQMESRLGRDVELSSVRLKLLPRFAVRLDDFAIANPPEFSSQPMLSVQALDLQVRLLPLLLRREIQLVQLRLVRPAFRYEVNAEGVTNLAGLGGDGGAEAVAPEAGAASALAAGFVVNDLLIRDGSVFYLDERSGRRASSQLQARLTADRAGDEGAIVGRGQIEASSLRLERPQPEGSQALPDLDIDYALLADPRGDSLALSDLRLSVGEVPFTGSALLRGLSGGRTVQLVLESGEVEVADLLGSLPDSSWSAATQASGIARLSLRAAGPLGDGALPELKGEIRLQGVRAAYADKGVILSEGRGDVTFDMKSLTVPAFEGKLLGGPFKLRLDLQEFTDPSVAAHLLGDFDLGALIALRGSAPPLSGAASVDVNVGGPVKRIEAIQINGPITLSDVRYQTDALAVPARIGEATLRFTGSGLASRRLPIALGSSDLTVSFDAPGILPYALSRGASAAPAVEFAATSRLLDVSEILVSSEEELGYSNLMAARLAGRQIDGVDPAEIARARYKLPALPPLEATGRVEIGEFRNPPTIARDVSFEIVAKDGVVRARQIRGRVYNGQVRGNASLNLSRGRPPFPLRYNFRLSGAQAGAFLNRWTRLGSALGGTVDFQIDGRTTLDDALLPTTRATNASGAASFRDGSFQDFGLVRALASQLKLDASVLSGFRQLGGAFAIEDGAFVLDAWKLTAKDITANIGGSAGLGGSLDLQLAVQVPPALLERSGLIQGAGPLGGLAAALSRDGRPIELSFGIGGTMSNPALRLDANALQKALEARLGDAENDLLRRLIKPPR